MTDAEKLKLAIELLEKFANEANMQRAAASMSQFGRAGAGMAYEDVRKAAQATLEKIR